MIGLLLLLETIDITNPRARTAAPEKSIVKILMQFYESVHEILYYYNRNETSLALLLHGFIWFGIFTVHF